MRRVRAGGGRGLGIWGKGNGRYETKRNVDIPRLYNVILNFGTKCGWYACRKHLLLFHTLIYAGSIHSANEL